MRKILAAFAVAGLLSAPVMAAPCRDAKGKFVKCDKPAAAAKKGPCKDAKGKFIKCPK